MYSLVLATATAALKETKEVKTDMLRSISKQSRESVESVLKKCKQSAPRSRQITIPTPHHSIFYRPDALPDAQATVWALVRKVEIDGNVNVI